MKYAFAPTKQTKPDFLVIQRLCGVRGDPQKGSGSGFGYAVPPQDDKEDIAVSQSASSFRRPWRCCWWIIYGCLLEREMLSLFQARYCFTCAPYWSKRLRGSWEQLAVQKATYFSGVLFVGSVEFRSSSEEKRILQARRQQARFMRRIAICHTGNISAEMSTAAL